MIMWPLDGIFVAMSCYGSNKKEEGEIESRRREQPHADELEVMNTMNEVSTKVFHHIMLYNACDGQVKGAKNVL